MGEPKPFASLTSGLLARKGTAKPAMRRQYLGGGMGLGHEDLGWNDMGEDIASAQQHPHAGLSPLPSHPAVPEPQPAWLAAPSEARETAIAPVEVPAVVEQRQMLAEKVANGQFEEEPAAPKAKAGKAKARPVGLDQRKSKAAFTLRLDADRHLKLRLACAVSNRSAQQLVTEALDELLEQWPHVEQLAEQLPERRAAGQA
ncbi:MAG TPA: hypothetical protein VJM81_06910 [Rhizorhapis sp.]|nr:hypothetical protein [Rhizorhapis sp.]